MRGSKKLLAAAFAVLLAAAHGAETANPMQILKTTGGAPVNYAGKVSSSPVMIPTSYTQKARELRGVWVATVDNIDFGQHDSAESFRREYLEILNNIQAANMNAIFFQVRPLNDAYYPSALNPWSRYLTGAEGRAIINFDPLAFMVSEAHKRGIQFHAWLNPYRVAKNLERGKNEYVKTLDAKSFAYRNPAMVLEINKEGKRLLILDPGEPQVIRFVINTVQEIVQNYDVDGIHFDDYFYPYGGCGNIDSRTFAKNNPRRLSLEDWRRENVNTLIQGVGRAIAANNAAKKRQVQFGISPFGIWRNNNSDPKGSPTAGSESYSNQHADSLLWIRSGWIDYIVPQVYWHFEHNVAAYAAVTDWWVWAVKGTKVNLYIGHAPAFCGVNPGWNNTQELPNQLRYNTKHPEIRGEVMFSYKSMFRPGNKNMHRNMETIYKQYWTKRAMLPSCGPYVPAPPQPAASVPANPETKSNTIPPPEKAESGKK